MLRCESIKKLISEHFPISVNCYEWNNRRYWVWEITFSSVHPHLSTPHAHCKFIESIKIHFTIILYFKKAFPAFCQKLNSLSVMKFKSTQSEWGNQSHKLEANLGNNIYNLDYSSLNNAQVGSSRKASPTIYQATCALKTLSNPLFPLGIAGTLTTAANGSTVCNFANFALA